MADHEHRWVGHVCVDCRSFRFAWAEMSYQRVWTVAIPEGRSVNLGPRIHIFLGAETVLHVDSARELHTQLGAALAAAGEMGAPRG